MTINEAMTLLVAELEDNEIPMPLSARFVLANIWADLTRLADEDLPSAVLAVVGEALDQRCEPVLTRGSHRDHARQFGPETWLPAD